MEYWHFLVDFSDIYLESIHFNLYAFLSVSACLSVLLPGLERDFAVVPVSQDACWERRWLLLEAGC